jgi:hypothetical protein
MLLKNSDRTSKRTQHSTLTKINWLMPFNFNLPYVNESRKARQFVLDLPSMKLGRQEFDTDDECDIFVSAANKLKSTPYENS